MKRRSRDLKEKKRGVMKNYEGNNKQFGSLHGQAEDPSFIISFPRAFGKVCVTKLPFFFPSPSPTLC